MEERYKAVKTGYRDIKSEKRVRTIGKIQLIIEAKETERANMHKKSAKKVLNSPK